MTRGELEQPQPATADRERAGAPGQGPWAWLWRPQCPACGALLGDGAGPLCPPCTEGLLPLGAACPRCAAPLPERPALCARCAAGPLPLEVIAAPWRFGGPLASAIYRLKLAGHAHVARAVAPLWAPAVAAAVGAEPGAVVVPVPQHWRRRLARGLDHAWLLARHACASASLAPPVAALRRVRATPPQRALGAAARAANLRGAFAVRDPDSIAGRVVVLVDDVVTTGATLAAAAAALREGGATAVIGVALARAG